MHFLFKTSKYLLGWKRGFLPEAGKLFVGGRVDFEPGDQGYSLELSPRGGDTPEPSL